MILLNAEDSKWEKEPSVMFQTCQVGIANIGVSFDVNWWNESGVQ